VIASVSKKGQVNSVQSVAVIQVPSEERKSLTHQTLLSQIRHCSSRELDSSVTHISGYIGKKAAPTGSIALLDLPDDKLLSEFVSDATREVWWGVVVFCKPPVIDEGPKKKVYRFLFKLYRKLSGRRSIPELLSLKNWRSSAGSVNVEVSSVRIVV
jgi:hypothetical protein